MDNGLVPPRQNTNYSQFKSLNPCCSGQWSRTQVNCPSIDDTRVLILIVVDNGLVQVIAQITVGRDGS